MPPGPLIKDPDKRRLATAVVMAGVLAAVIAITWAITGASLLPASMDEPAGPGAASDG